MKAIQIRQTGGPEVMALSDVPVPSPKAGEALVRIHASGVNFIDVYFREGRYKTELPFIDGQEAAGTVEAVGEGVRDLKPGDAVAWTGVMGSYAEYAAVPADRLVKTPEGLDPKLAAAVMLQGLTAHYLSHSTHALKPGEIALVHAAAGGVGLLLTQMASQAGARVIGTVSTKEKAELAREAGAAEVILYTEVDFETETRRLTDGRGVDVVYDSVGKTTFEKSLNSLRPRGMMVLYGGSSGAVPPFDLIELAGQGIALCHASDVETLHTHAGRAGGACRRGAGCSGCRQAEGPHGAHLSTGRCAPGAYRAAGTQDNGKTAADSIKWPAFPLPRSSKPLPRTLLN